MTPLRCYAQHTPKAACHFPWDSSARCESQPQAVALTMWAGIKDDAARLGFTRAEASAHRAPIAIWQPQLKS